jgi:hypothetical protein
VLSAQIRNPKDFWTGVLYMTIGLGAVYIAQDYRMGTAVRMGPGYFPIVLGALLALIGLFSLVRSFIRQGEPIGAFAIRATILVIAGVLLTGFLIRRGGLVVALPVLIMVTSYASIKFSWGRSVALAIGLTAFCVLVFAKGLGLPLPILGTWFGA